MEKLMKNPNVLMVGAGVLAFIGVRYLLNKREEEKSGIGGLQPYMAHSNKDGFGMRNEGVSNACGCGG